MGRVAQSEIAKRAGVSKSIVSQYLRGTEPSLFRAVKLADVLGVSLRWLATGEGGGQDDSSTYHMAPIYDVQLAGPTAAFLDAARKIGEMPIDSGLLSRISRTDTRGLAAFNVEGDAMEPLISDGARVLIDLEDTRLREGVWAYRIRDEVSVKRLRRLADGVEILSENPRYEPERLHGDQLKPFTVIGRALLTARIL
jgi:phage repressor protein C with HTH and peptisase S24 domain